MSNYTKTTDFEAKDSLPTGDSGKIIRGAEFETEFDAISTAIATKADTAGPTFTGTLTFETISDGTIGVTAFVDEDDMSSNSATLVPTQQSVKAYVDSQVTAQDLDFQADTGGALSIDLDSETMTFTGGTGIDTSGSGNAVTFAIDSTVATLTGSQTLTNKTLTSPVLNTGVSGTAVLDEDDMSSNSATQLATQQSIKAYVDSQVGANNELSEILANGNTTGGTNIVFGDSASVSDDRLVFGAGSDLQIYHSGTHSYIDDAGTGNLTLRGNASVRVEKYEGEILADFAADGAVSLYHDNSVKIATTSTGVNVTGTVEFDGLSGTGSVNVTDILDQDDMSSNSATALATQQSIKAYVDSQVATVDTLSEVLANGNTTGGTDIAVGTGDDVTFADSSKAIFGAGSDLQIYHDGSNSFVTDEGTGDLILRGANVRLSEQSGNENFVYCSANGAVTLYYDNAAKLATTSTGIDVTGVITTDGMTTSANINFGDNDKAVFGAGNDLEIYHSGTDSYIADTGTGDLNIKGSNNIYLLSGASELYAKFTTDGAATLYYDNAAKIATTSTGIDVTGTAVTDGLTVAGNVLVGKTSSALNTEGVELQSDRIYATRDGGQALAVNRKTSDGALVSFHKDGTTVGSIGTNSGIPYFLRTSGGIAIGNTALLSADGSGAINDATSDLGGVSNRWKDLYLSGTANAAGLSVDGGTIKLDGNYPLGTENVALGNDALYTINSTGNFNVAIGSEALYSTTTGDNNTGVGMDVLRSNTTASNNTALGFQALRANTTGASNVGVGYRALYANTTAAGNVAVGPAALTANTTGATNTAIGNEALDANTTASNNTAVGHASLGAATTGAENAAFGSNAASAVTVGTKNTALGAYALRNDTQGSSSVAIGHQALNAQNFTSATNAYNVAVGANAGVSVTTGKFNTAVGGLALDAETAGGRSVAIGYASLGSQNQTSAVDVYNVGVGFFAGTNVTTGVNNTFVGGLAGDAITTGSDNTAVGTQALSAGVASFYNTAFGYQALATDTTGRHSVAVGRLALQAQNNTSSADMYNVAVGSGAGKAITTGANNTLIGGLAGDATTTGTGNNALGYNALGANTTGDNNQAFGVSALLSNTTGAGNIGIGLNALYSNTTANHNIAIGTATLDANTTGANNVGIGNNALGANTTASNNNALGSGALANNTTGSANNAFGLNALGSNTTPNHNSAFGSSTLGANTTGASNSGFGSNALLSNTTGSNNTAVGAFALDANTTAANNVAVGYHALRLNTTGATNTALGSGALDTNTTGSLNVAIGGFALDANTTGSNNVAVGYGAIDANTTGSNNAGVGYFALGANVTGAENTAVGSFSLDANTVGYYNVAVGHNALTGDTQGSRSTALGYAALQLQNFTSATDTYNTAVGFHAGYQITTGVRNTLIGGLAGDSITTGNGNVVVGESSGAALTTGTDNTMVGPKSGQLMTTGSDNTIIGNFSGNQGGLDIRTSNGHIVLSDGDGNPRLSIDANGAERYCSDNAGAVAVRLVAEKASIASATTTNFIKIKGQSGNMYGLLTLKYVLDDVGVDIGTGTKTFRLFWNGSTSLLNALSSDITTRDPTIAIASASGTEVVLSITQTVNSAGGTYNFMYDMDWTSHSGGLAQNVSLLEV